MVLTIIAVSHIMRMREDGIQQTQEVLWGNEFVGKDVFCIIDSKGVACRYMARGLSTLRVWHSIFYNVEMYLLLGLVGVGGCGDGF